jgi:hypothetical protein
MSCISASILRTQQEIQGTPLHSILGYRRNTSSLLACFHLWEGKRVPPTNPHLHACVVFKGRQTSRYVAIKIPLAVGLGNVQVVSLNSPSRENLHVQVGWEWWDKNVWLAQAMKAGRGQLSGASHTTGGAKTKATRPGSRTKLARRIRKQTGCAGCLNASALCARRPLAVCL